MPYLLSLLIAMIITGCIPSQIFTQRIEAQHLTNQCYKLKKPIFVFEGRCADLTGLNNNSELCNSLQAANQGGFPKDWVSYLEIRQQFDKKMFNKLAFEKQRTMFAYLKRNTEIKITKVVHHGWGSNGLYWIIRGDILVNGKIMEIELPSFDRIHPAPEWFNGREENVPILNSEYIEPC